MVLCLYFISLTTRVLHFICHLNWLRKDLMTIMLIYGEYPKPQSKIQYTEGDLWCFCLSTIHQYLSPLIIIPLLEDILKWYISRMG